MVGPGRTTTSVLCRLITQCVIPVEAKNAAAATAVAPARIAQAGRRLFIATSAQHSCGSKAR